VGRDDARAAIRAQPQDGAVTVGQGEGEAGRLSFGRLHYCYGFCGGNYRRYIPYCVLSTFTARGDRGDAARRAGEAAEGEDEMTEECKQRLADARREKRERDLFVAESLRGPITFEELRRRGAHPLLFDEVRNAMREQIDTQLRDFRETKAILESDLDEETKYRIVKAMYPSVWRYIQRHEIDSQERADDELAVKSAPPVVA
jgi:hypothetical protein